MSKPKFIGVAKQTGFQTQQNCDFVALAPEANLAAGKDLIRQRSGNSVCARPLAYANPAFFEFLPHVSNSTNWYDLGHDGQKCFENEQLCSEFRTS